MGETHIDPNVALVIGFPQRINQPTPIWHRNARFARSTPTWRVVLHFGIMLDDLVAAWRFAT